MNTLMNAYNRRAEVAATLTNTMGRQKTRLFSVPAKSCRREREREEGREREREGARGNGLSGSGMGEQRRCNERATEEKRRRLARLANEPALFVGEEARLFRAGCSFSPRWWPAKEGYD